MKQYLALLEHILQNGTKKEDRTGVGTLSVFGYQMRFDLEEGFPLLTTKKVHLKSIIYELLWFLSGNTNIRYLQDHGVTIWDEWADENGDIGPAYGYQWRSWPNWINVTDHSLELEIIANRPIDQISDAINLLKTNPDSRRIIVTAWNPSDVPKMKLPSCHCFFQFYVANNKLSCQMYQRSCDTFLGVPFNIASYALLTMMFARVCEFDLGELVWTGGDVHLYLNHLDQAKEQLTRTPNPLPVMLISPIIDNIFKFNYTDFVLEGYNPYPVIKAPVAV